NGKASYYADKFVGRKTANGEIFRQGKMTAAHKTLPFGTKVKVKNLNNGRTIKVRINDRGPFVAGRIIDLSRKGARKLGMIRDGVVPVVVSYKGKSPCAWLLWFILISSVATCPFHPQTCLCAVHSFQTGQAEFCLRRNTGFADG